MTKAYYMGEAICHPWIESQPNTTNLTDYYKCNREYIPLSLYIVRV